jgi:hypothetical protein
VEGEVAAVVLADGESEPQAQDAVDGVVLVGQRLPGGG